MSPAILVEKLSKTYQVSEREGGFRAAIQSFIHRKDKDVPAVGRRSTEEARRG